jgi:hypothetical protein
MNCFTRVLESTGTFLGKTLLGATGAIVIIVSW